MALRTDDRFTLAAPVIRPDDGAWLFEGVAVSPGVLVYQTPNGPRRELVTDKAIADTVAGLADRALTLHHPRDARGLPVVGPDNAAAAIIGNATAARVDETTRAALVSLTVRDARAMRQIEAWKAAGRPVGLSVGYDATVEERPGVDPVHGPYDAVQVARPVVNHFALTPSPRDPSAVVRTDEADPMNLPLLMTALVAAGILPAGYDKMNPEELTAADKIAADKVTSAAKVAAEAAEAAAEGARMDAIKGAAPAGYEVPAGKAAEVAGKLAEELTGQRADSFEENIQAIKIAGRVLARKLPAVRADAKAGPTGLELAAANNSGKPASPPQNDRSPGWLNT